MKKQLSVLLVEDNPSDAELNVRFLAKGGYEVVSERVETAAEMRLALSQHAWDLVLSDYRMPNFSSLEALSILRDHKIDIPFIVVSGTIGEDVAVEIMKAGAHDYVLKDRPARLLPAVERELQEASVRRARVDAEVALGESEERFHRLLIQAPIPMAFVDAEGTVIDLNNRFVEVLGYTRDDVPTLKDWWSIAFPDEDYRLWAQETWHDAVDRAVASGSTIQPVEAVVRCKGGVRRIFEVSGSMIGGDLLASLVDRTANKEAEAQREQLQEQLRQAQKLEAIGTLAGGIAHDFNNILGALIGHAQLLQMSVEQDETPDWSSLDEILSAAGRAKDLVRQILTFSRRTEVNKQPMHLDMMVKEALKLLRGALPAFIEIRTDIAPHCGIVVADTTHMHQVIMNLCTNAAHAMGETGGLLAIGLRPVTLRGEDTAARWGLLPGSYLALTVSDTGCGIPPDHLEHIFEPFFTTKPQGEGTGLGLSVVHGIVREHGGAIEVKSEVDQGTTFQVLLPCIDRFEEEVKAPEEFSELPRGHERILLVDDEEALLAVGSKMLLALGYEVVVRNDVEAACALVLDQHEPFDLIITDLMMPKITGIEFRRRLSEAGADIPMLLVTGYSEAAAPGTVAELGFLDVLRKPLGMPQVAVGVRRALDARERE